MVTVAQIIVPDVAALYASRKPVRVEGEDARVSRLRAPA